MASQEPKQQSRLMGEFLRDAIYDGRPGQTHSELIHYSCQCGAIYPVNVLRAVNVATDREFAEAAVAGKLNHTQCQKCSRQTIVEVPYILHHPQEERFVLVIPEHQRHREFELRGRVLKHLDEATSSSIPTYVANFQVVFGTEGLRTSLARPPGHAALREEQVHRLAEIEERERQTAEFERVHAMRDAQLAEKERAVEQQEESVLMREERLKERGEHVTRMEDELRQREASHQAQLEALDVRSHMLDQREAELEKKEQALTVRTKALQEWEGRLLTAEQYVATHGRDVGRSSSAPLSSPSEHPKNSTGPKQDIVSSLMHDPEQEELSRDKTQPNHSISSEQVKDSANGKNSELIDEELSEEVELSVDDLIESETGIHAMPPEGTRTPVVQKKMTSRSMGVALQSTPVSGGPTMGGPASTTKSSHFQRRPSPPPPRGSSDPAAEAGPLQSPPTRPFLQPPVHWVQSEEKTTIVQMDDDYYLLTRTDEATAEKIKGENSDLLIQLHQLPTYPLITLSLVFDIEADDFEALHWFIDIDVEKDRFLLQQLRRRFRINVLLYDLNYELYDEVTFEPPREVNAAHITDRATQLLREIDPGDRDFEQALETFCKNWDWFGKKRHPFSETAYAEINDIAEAKISLGILNYWSEPKNHEYLVLTKSVPVDLLETITRRILDGALRFGLWLPQAMKERAVALALASDLQTLTAKLVDSFTALGPEPANMDLSEAAKNWQSLLRDADELDVPISKETLKLAESIIENATATEEQEDQENEPLALEAIEEMSDEKVISLLERRSSRKRAILELASRNNETHLEALFRAARKMGRADLVPVIPALLRYGESAGDYFVEGLTARKSFTRQACALALGELKLRRAVVPLLHQLFAEKTQVWQEIARALGHYGPTGIKPLHRYLRAPKGKEERLVRAMAFFAINGAVKQIEEIASNDDVTIAALGVQALEMRETVRTMEDLVLGVDEIQEQTPLLKFSRRLHQAIVGEDQQREDELLEELGDSDIMGLEEGEE